MQQEEQIIIAANKQFFIVGFLGSICFISFSIWMLYAEPTKKYLLLYLKLFGVMGLAFFGICCVYFIKKYFDNKPLLILNKQGIWFNTFFFSGHQITWKELQGVSLIKIQREKIIYFYLVDNQSFIRKFSFFRRLFLTINIKFTNAPFGISTRIIQGDAEQIKRQIEYRIKNWV